MSKHKIPYQKERLNEEEQLWNYVSGSMPPDKAHDTESDKLDDPFWNDAVEGLEQLEDKQKIKNITVQLQQQIRKQTASKGKKKKGIQGHWQGMVITVLLLLLIVICYLFFHFGVKR
ncbi:hypothetical protein DBR32_05755 [Taibaiella sp. KBW10]|uniref:hypothetical protein n=1 Tax=Taibaiella sp. KBW10 TaxID=2153357 RepID=UPI000F5AB0D4|nr:hypothetical protein [Taibaiella sp. KBW10]RQO31465.1 hypothetical protein DBR32_05755 [Taibaiella sp. KBW10]